MLLSTIGKRARVSIFSFPTPTPLCLRSINFVLDDLWRENRGFVNRLKLQLQFKLLPSSRDSHVQHRQTNIVWTSHGQGRTSVGDARNSSCSLRSRRLEWMDARKNWTREGDTRGERGFPLPTRVSLVRPVLSCVHYFQQAIQAPGDNGNKVL